MGEAVSERDYLERTIATVRNHRSADNCWPQWANIFADEIESLWAERLRLLADVEALREALRAEFFKQLPDMDYEVDGLLGGRAWAWEIHPWFRLLGLSDSECYSALAASSVEGERGDA